MGTILSAKKLNKKYGKKQVLFDVSFEINEGEILGFIGPNGAGKTTTIKLITALQHMDSGEVKINGYDLKKDYEKAIEKVGAIIESPDLYMYMSGKKNLELIAMAYGKNNKEVLDKAIKVSGLGKRINDKVSTYSLGMRQRLGIAAALINEPNLLILDEPTNGLDPEGIKDLRNFLVEISKEGTSVFISSHNLSELENFITNVVIIQNGHIVASATKKELETLKEPTYKFDVDDGISAKHILGDEIVASNTKKTITVRVKKNEIPDVVKKLVKKDVEIYQIVEQKNSLEDVFLEKTGGNEIV